MAVISRGQKKEYVDEVKSDGVATQVELNTHETIYAHAPVAVPGTDDGLYLRFDGANYIWTEAVPGSGQDGLPTQTGNTGKHLATDGTTAYWTSDGVIPPHQNNPDTVLTTDGVDVFWQINSGGGTEGGIPVEPYYHDMTRDRYLAFDTIIVDFYMDGTNRKNMYMYQVPGIPSNSVPYKIDGEYCLIGWDFFATSIESGNIINIVDSNSNVVLPITLSTTTSSESNTSENTLVTDKLLSSYINSNGVDTPVVKIYLKKTYYPDV